MKHLIAIAAATILSLSAQAQMDPAYQKAFDHSVREHPPGDYKKTSQSPALITEAVDINKPASPLKQRLASVIIPKIDFKDKSALEALGIFADVCRKNDPAGQDVPIVLELAFAAEVSRSQASPISASLKDMSAEGVLDYLALLVPFKYEYQDHHILIRQNSNSVRIKPKTASLTP